MKTYISKGTRLFLHLGIALLVGGLVGILLAVLRVGSFALQAGLISGLALGILFFSGGLASKTRTLCYDEEKVRLPARRKGLRFSDIQRIERRWHKGDGIIAGSSWEYRFTLRDGSHFDTFLYEYGKYEDEIFQALTQRTEKAARDI